MASNIQKALSYIKAEIEERKAKNIVDEEYLALENLVKVLKDFRIDQIRVANSELRVRGDWRVIKFENGIILAIPLK